MLIRGARKSGTRTEQIKIRSKVQILVNSCSTSVLAIKEWLCEILPNSTVYTENP
jgi:hypothetical protein